MASALTPSDDASNMRIENDEKLRRDMLVLFKNLRAQAISNMEYYQDMPGSNYERFHSAFRCLYEHLDRGIEPGIEYLLRIVHIYDYDATLPANGYRSMIKTIHRCCIKILSLARYITVNRESFLFRSGHYSREIEAYVTTLGQLRACLYYLQKLVSYCQEGDLFPDESIIADESNEYESAESLMMEFESLSQETFYGRCLGFQFCDSMIKPLSTIILAMASYGDGYEQDSTLMKFASSLLGGSRYILDPEQRAQKVVNMTRNGDVHFCKSFWHIAETDLMHQLPLFVCPSVDIDKVIIIPAESFDMLKADGSGYVKVTPPCAHSGPGPVHTRLISYLLRDGQEVWKSKSSPTKPTAEGSTAKTAAPPKVFRKSPCLLVQCHGGGFVAQSSASHQSYLRSWARDLRIPILCVDYSLAPEFPFPRQLEEILYAVCWARKNAHLLGWTGEKLGICGDSAGGNLALSVTMRLLTMDLAPPDAVLSMYGCMLVHYVPSPSRMMTLMDPLLPMGIMASCLAAYSGMAKEAVVTVPFEAIRSHSINSDCTPGGSTAKSGEASRSQTPSKTPTNAEMKRSPLIEEKSPQIEVESPRNGEKSPDTSTAKSPDITSTDSFPASQQPKLRHRSTLSNKSYDSGYHDNRPDNRFDNYSSPEPSSPEYNSGASMDISSPEHSRMSESWNSLEEKSPELSPKHEPSEKENKPDRSSMHLDLQEHASKRERIFPKSPSLPVFHSLTGDPYKLPPQADMSIGSPFRSCTVLALVGRTVTDPEEVQEVVRARETENWAVSRIRLPLLLGLTRSPPAYAQIRHFAQSPVVQFRHLPIAKNPYMSPYLASDDLLAKLPPVYLVACHLDPFLDDSIMLAKKLKSLGKEVHLEVLDDLPHGFLSFTLVSRDARQAASLCVQQVRDMLNLDAVDWSEFEILSEESFADYNTGATK